MILSRIDRINCAKEVIMKNISILRSTGSIGTSRLWKSCLKNSDTLNIVGLTTHTNIDLLEQQISAYSPGLYV